MRGGNALGVVNGCEALLAAAERRGLAEQSAQN
jgi:hypothetical protein